MPGPAFKLIDASPTANINMGAGVVNGANTTPTIAVLSVSNPGTANLVITAINVVVTVGGPTDFVLANGSLGQPFAALPVTIAPGSNKSINAVIFNPTLAAGSPESATLAFVSNAVSGTVNFTLQALSTGTPLGCLLGWKPNTIFGGNSIQSHDLGVGIVAGQVFTFLVYVLNANHLGGNIVVNAVANAAAGFVVTPASLNLPPSTLNFFTLTLTVPTGSGLQDTTNALEITTAGNANSTCDFEVFYSFAPFVSAFTLTGTVEATLLGLNTGVVDQFLPANACEDVISFSRQYYVDQPHLNKVLNRLWMFFERQGVFTLTATASVVNPSGTPNAVGAFAASAASDGKNGFGVFDIQVTGSCIQLSFTMPANSGLLSLIGFMMKVDEIGEIIEGT